MLEDRRKIYFAYGSNLDEAQMKERCSDAEIMGTAYLKDYRLNFRKSQTGYYATLDHVPGDSVEGLLWLISKSDELSLDRREGVGKVNCYYKQDLEVQTEAGPVKAYTYLLEEDRPMGPAKADYLDKLRKGYKRFSFDEQKLEEAIENSAVDY